MTADLRHAPDGRILLLVHRHPGGAVDLCPVERGPTDPDHPANGYRVHYPDGWRHARQPDGRRRPIVTMQPEAVASLPAYHAPPTLLAPRLTEAEARVKRAWERLGDLEAVERALWCERPRLSRDAVREAARRLGLVP